ncbi:hypothetical protein [Rhodococcus sp. ACT016]|uniref:hypothetical protein n=1 Tax=Rhodococcus sp. ACT016 TaxID=3134808 RepID=UPI003D270B3F
MIIAALLAVLFLVRFVLSICDESDYEREIARINRDRRRAETQINQIATAAMQQMTNVMQREQNRRESP